MAAELSDEVAHEISRQPHFFVAIVTLVQDERPRAVAQLDDALPVELGIGFDDRVGADHELLRERADAGKLIARRQNTALDRVQDLLHQLDVDRYTTGRVQA